MAFLQVLGDFGTRQAQGSRMLLFSFFPSFFLRSIARGPRLLADTPSRTIGPVRQTSQESAAFPILFGNSTKSQTMLKKKNRVWKYRTRIADEP